MIGPGGQLGFREITICDEEYFAVDWLDITVKSFKEPLPTDDPPVITGPFSCTNADPDLTAPVQSYTFQTLCRQVKRVDKPKRIAEVKSLVTDAAASGVRLRVIGYQHSSNSQLCTEGRVIVTENLKDAVPIKNANEPDLTNRFDLEAVLSGSPVIEDFEGHKTVRVGAGMRLGDLMSWLDGQGWSLGFAVPGFREPTVGGAIATGTHGSSPRLSVVLSSRVCWLLMVLPDGTLKEFSEQTTDSDTWRAVRASLGFLGVVVQLRLEVEPAFNLKVKVRWVTAKDLVSPGGPYSLVAGCDYGQMVWFPQRGDENAPVMVICGHKTDEPDQGVENRLLRPLVLQEEFFSELAIDGMENDVCSGRDLCSWESFRSDIFIYAYPPYTNTDHPEGIVKTFDNPPPHPFQVLFAAAQAVNPFLLDPFTWIAAALMGPREPEVVGKSYLCMSSDFAPIRPLQRDWEIFIPKSRALDSLAAALAYFKANRICLPLTGVFIRFAPAEPETLIAHTVAEGNFNAGEAGMFFEMPVFLPKRMKCSDQARYEKVYSDLAEMLVSQFDGRAHWGKNRRSLFQLQRRLKKYGDNLKRFRKVVRTMDPKGLFANQFGIDMGLHWQQSAPIPADTETRGCIPD